jgi:methionine-rich copper-binding protein CopC
MKKVFVLAVTALLASTAFAHARLERSTPADGATVASSPAELRLQYNEPVEAAMSTVKLDGPSGAPVALDKATADKQDNRTLVVALPKLAAGDYRVDWATMGRDGHHTKGQLHFTVK